MTNREQEAGLAAPADLAASRSLSYWFLADFFLSTPSAEWLTALRGQLSGAQFADADPLAAPMRALAKAAVSADVGVLLIEHTRIFAGLSARNGPPPYESQNRANGDEARHSVAERYRFEGFAALELPGVPADHLGTELRCLSLLCARERDCWLRSQPIPACELLRSQADFLDEHLLAWVPGYCDGLVERTNEPFYRALADLTKAAVTHDRAQIDALLFETAGLPGSPVIGLPLGAATEKTS